MPSCGKTIKRLALAALLLCPALTASALTDLRPTVSDYTASSITFSWNSSGTFVAAISTNSNFSTFIATGPLTSNTTTYTNLNLNTTYYFQVKKQSEGDAAYALNRVTVSTWAAAPSAPYFEPSRFSAVSSSLAVAGLGWNTGGNPDWTIYEVQYASNPAFSGALAADYQLAAISIDVGGLDANTTYYFSIRARAFRGAYSSSATVISTATMALELSGLRETLDETSVTVNWAPVSDTIQALTSEGYRILYSVSELMTGPAERLIADAATSSAVLTPLTRNTTYYYRAGALNWNGAAKFSDRHTFTTLAAALLNFQKLSVADYSARLGWTALPSAPVTATAAGYRLEASTSAAFETYLSSGTPSVLLSTLTVSALDSNTTYYFRAAALNAAGNPNYTAVVASVTLAAPIPENQTYTVPDTMSLEVFFNPLPPAPPGISCEGYRLEASTLPFGAGGTVISSVTHDNQLDRLVVRGLASNADYYLRLGTLNWQDTPNYTDLDMTRTLLPQSFSRAVLASVWQSSAAAAFSPGDETPDGFVAEASLYTFPSEFFTGIFASSVTYDPQVSTLTITGLPHNKKFYFRVGALFNGATVYLNTTPSRGYTRAPPLAGVMAGGVFASSVTVTWTPLASTDSNHYLLEAAAGDDFSPVLFFSSTAVSSEPGLTISGLEPNTSYYFRAGTFDEEGDVTYVVTPATSTLANAPVPRPFGISHSTLTLNWLPDSNPPDTLYRAELADNSGFLSLSSSATVLTSATFEGLASNTPYWSRVTAVNRLGRETPAVSFSSIATAADFPGYAAYSDVGVTSVTVNWTPGLNPAGTSYLVGVSTNTDFSAVTETTTLNYQASFGGLISNASYYLRVGALNLDGLATDPATPLGTALTRPATAYLFPVTTQTFTAFMIDGFSVNWGGNGNSPLTRYNVEISTMPEAFFVMYASRSVTAETCPFSDLPMNTTYWARIQAEGQSGLLSDFVSTGTARTLMVSHLHAVAQKDNTISLETSYGTISVYLPRGSLGSSTIIDLRPVSVFAPPVSAVADLRPTGIGISITYYPAPLILNAITITLPYRPGSLPGGTDRAKLVIALYDEISGIWVPLPSVSDTSGNRVVAQTWHLSTFQLMETVSQTALSEVKIYPNPYKPNTTAEVMHFTNMTPYAKVRIYTFLGELVRDLKADINGMAYWDGRNNAGEKAASGVYIAYIRSSDKKKDKTFKIALER
ncbi:MAG: hypothetical protein NTY45_07425 [Elusimicrobia bacterium]|nr:hypothetical protein [Elusimicrobiota bacterium]